MSICIVALLHSNTRLTKTLLPVPWRGPSGGSMHWYGTLTINCNECHLSYFRINPHDNVRNPKWVGEAVFILCKSIKTDAEWQQRRRAGSSHVCASGAAGLWRSMFSGSVCLQECTLPQDRFHSTSRLRLWQTGPYRLHFNTVEIFIQLHTAIFILFYFIYLFNFI